MDDPDLSEEELKLIADAIAAYLLSNSKFHMRYTSTGHSWPCGVWDTCPQKSLADKLLIHGIVPRNLLFIKRIPNHGKETLRNPEGDQ